MRSCLWLVVGASVWLIGCSRQESTPASTGPDVVTTGSAEAGPSLAALDRGARLFQEHCAQCHGPEAQGHPDWQTPGVVAAPPLDGTGNDAKRSRAELIAVIENGAKRNGVLVMPGWKQRMTDAEINDVVAWFQALWPPDVYGRWQRAQTAQAGAK